MLAPKIYFPNLNGLRAIAALLVVVHHTEMMKAMYKIDNQWESSPFIVIAGHLGVVLFFVLSGFLITYLLLAEEKQTQNIDIKAFYIRRALRIFPLYFLVIVLALFVLPQFSFWDFPDFDKKFLLQDFPLKIFLFFTFFSNFVLSHFGALPYAAQTWSVSTEEQFYLIWVLLLKYFKSHRLILMLGVIGGYLGMKILLQIPFFIPHHTMILGYWNMFNIDCMAIGGIFAVLSFEKYPIIKYLQNTFFFYFILLLSISLLIMGYQFPIFQDKCYALLFGILILNFAQNPNLAFSLENKVLNYLGKLSYSLYMFHFVGIVLAIQLSLRSGWVSPYFINLLSILFTIGIASISYHYFEQFFLSYKEHFRKA